ncbi:class I SAM-dependent methyltransferase [Paenibacillus sp. MMS20-IR301]|uniref:class I SAM-dependent methyltransferase n=1 Tax=Paenibacillus sp. MMS20-IR301 TaxID=2895946 RepID=UPI0028E1BE37|nr:class I SAM-dependent methyltransferase [Paenibacillus sp. MMS20-IR301]WNS46874.1 class I SAM-dependent methyltransferase [Paenibacillus sp. MMS20-IR301]
MHLKQNESSMTSLISAFGRAYHSRYDSPKIFDDYMAEAVITAQEFAEIRANMIKGIAFFNPELALQYQDDPEAVLKWITQVQLSPTALGRSAYCEGILLRELALGVGQVVILGAGLDTFALRHSSPDHQPEIFEVDYPATQAFKRKRLLDAELEIPGHLHFVPMDFTRRFSYAALSAEGFNLQSRTFFTLLGVTYYLTKEETASLLRDLFHVLPSGSSIVFDYADEGLFETQGLSGRVEKMVQLAAASGEPMKSCFAYGELEQLLEQAGLLIYEHLSPADIQEKFFSSRNDYLSAFETIHYIHAVKK